jgi:hypothetical protein
VKITDESDSLGFLINPPENRSSAELSEVQKITSMKRSICILPVICLYLYVCHSRSNATDTDLARSQIESILSDYYKTMSARDWKQYKSFFSDRATLTTIWQEESDSLPKIFTTTIDEFILQTKNGPDSQPIFEEKLLNATIETKNNLAQAWVRYSAKFGSKDNLKEWRGYNLISLIKHNEVWKIVSIVFESE